MSTARELIINTLREKSVLKQDVFANTAEEFQHFKTVLKRLADELTEQITAQDPRVTFKYEDQGEYGASLKVAGDILIFQMHTNVFCFDHSHHIWKTGYVREDAQRAYCGVVHVYNFLADSYKYNRLGDSGYLVARIFINKDRHFFVEGKRQLGILYNDFTNAVIDEVQVERVVESAILFALDFDLLTPPYHTMQEINLATLVRQEHEMRIKTGKRLGFKFQADDDQPH